MKSIDTLFKIINHLSRLKNLFLLVILTRLVFLEPNQLALIAEIVGGIIMLMTFEIDEEEDDDFED